MYKWGRNASFAANQWVQLAWRSERAAVRVQDITVTVNDQTYTVDRYQLNEQRWGTGSVDVAFADGGTTGRIRAKSGSTVRLTATE